MGGFRLFKRVSEEQSDSQSISQENEDPLHPLLAGDLVHDDIYTFIMSTEAEIKDKGKSDWLAKSLVPVQTPWFVMKCIARAIERLPVTHLKIVTLAYAAMNFVICLLVEQTSQCQSTCSSVPKIGCRRTDLRGAEIVFG